MVICKLAAQNYNGCRMVICKFVAQNYNGCRMVICKLVAQNYNGCGMVICKLVAQNYNGSESWTVTHNRNKNKDKDNITHPPTRSLTNSLTHSPLLAAAADPLAQRKTGADWDESVEPRWTRSSCAVPLAGLQTPLVCAPRSSWSCSTACPLFQSPLSYWHVMFFYWSVFSFIRSINSEFNTEVSDLTDTGYKHLRSKASLGSAASIGLPMRTEPRAPGRASNSLQCHTQLVLS